MEKRKSKGQAPRMRASTADVLGGVKPAKPAAERISAKWREQYDTLLKARERFANRRGGLVRDATEEQPSYSLHMADAGTDTYDRDFALSMASSEQSTIYEIEQAINRIRAGTYGLCELTGKPIEIERLKAVPWTRFSAQAEKELEKDGAVQRARLAPVEAVAKTSDADESEAGEDEEA
jgi:DnaK suppressor protein